MNHIEKLENSDKYILYCVSFIKENENMKTLFFPTLEIAKNVHHTLSSKKLIKGELIQCIGKRIFTQIDDQMINCCGHVIIISDLIESYNYKFNCNLSKNKYDEFTLYVFRLYNILPIIKTTKYLFSHRYIEYDEKTIRDMGLVS
jgi:hypothetical protein